MKLSNKILLGFFGIVFLYLTAAFAEVRFSGTPNVIDDKNSAMEKLDLASIGYLILNDCNREVKVVASDRHQLEIRSFSGGVLKHLKYDINGDTLTLSGFESKDSRNVRITVFVPNASLKGINVKSSTLYFEGFNQDQLHILGDAGRVWMTGNTIENFRINLSNKSLLNVATTFIDTVSADLDESQVHLSSPVGVVKGTLKNKSFMQLNNLQEIELKKDGNSELNMYR